MTRLLCVLFVLASLIVAPDARAREGAKALSEGKVTLYSRGAENERNHTKGYDRSAFNFELAVRSDANPRRRTYGFDLIYGSVTFDRDSDYFLVEIEQDDRSWIRDLGELEWFELSDVPAIEPSDSLRGISFGTDEGLLEKDSRGALAKVHAGHVYALRVKCGDSDCLVVFRVDELEPNERCDLSWRVVADYGTPAGD